VVRRIERALSAGFPVGIEQDLTWYVDPVSKQGRAVVAHNDKTGWLRAFTARLLLRACAADRRESSHGESAGEMAVIVLHFDFKSNPAGIASRDLGFTGEYQAWITTAEKTADTHELTQFHAGRSSS
jgi:hypothetical protein